MGREKAYGEQVKSCENCDHGNLIEAGVIWCDENQFVRDDYDFHPCYSYLWEGWDD